MAGPYPHAHDLKMVAPLPRTGVGKVKPQKRPQRKPEQPKQAPIQFHDAVGRKFFFPYEMVATWSVSRQYSLFDITLGCSLFCHGADDLPQGLERLVREAFIHITVIGPHVYEGHYDLVEPDGDIILPSVWEHVVVPGMSVTMHMWPLPEGTAGPEPEDEETRAAKEAGAHKPVRARMDADDPRWIPPPTVALEGVFGFLDSAGMANDTHYYYNKNLFLISCKINITLSLFTHRTSH
jgi:hypothetical protein